MPNLKSFFRYFLVPAVLLCTSCVKDVDLDQVDEVVFPPDATVDLVYFTVKSEDFRDSGSSQPLRARDLVRLEFLDDDYIQDGLIRADINFRYSNSFPFPIRNTIRFLSESNNELYRINIDIPAGSIGAPEVINYTEILQGVNINALKRSIKMEIQLEMPAAASPTEGELKLQSRAFFKFEF